MLVCMLKSKIHGAIVTDGDIAYEGSLGIAEDLMRHCGLFENERIDVYNITNGKRFSTYVIKEENGSGKIILNGAAARMAVKGDRIIIASYTYIEEKDAGTHTPRVIRVDERNRIK
ncbi:MAG: aspartate 1-decarboxylase [Oligoflexia bacterium]|nr:aspartate 1-decarboxylase [Oligoflexia bacterium]